MTLPPQGKPPEPMADYVVPVQARGGSSVRPDFPLFVEGAAAPGMIRAARHVPQVSWHGRPTRHEWIALVASGHFAVDRALAGTVTLAAAVPSFPQ